MALTVRHSNYEGVIGTVAIYEKAGEIIGLHQHPWDHSTHVIQGRTRIVIEGQKTFDMVVGEQAELPARIRHSIEALEDNTVIVNIIKDARPPGVREFAGIITHDTQEVVYPD